MLRLTFASVRTAECDAITGAFDNAIACMHRALGRMGDVDHDPPSVHRFDDLLAER